MRGFLNFLAELSHYNGTYVSKYWWFWWFSNWVLWDPGVLQKCLRGYEAEDKAGVSPSINASPFIFLFLLRVPYNLLYDEEGSSVQLYDSLRNQI